MQYVIGVDIGGTTIKFGMLNGKGDVLKKSVIPTSSKTAQELIHLIAEEIQALCKEFSISSSELLGVGVGIPAPVKNQDYVATCANLDCEDIHFAKELSHELGCAVRVENDANVAALGEQWKGAGQGAEDVVMLTLGTGVGGGIILGSKIHSGFMGAGGEIGHMPILETPDIRTCGCGNSLCLELVASATGMITHANFEVKQQRIAHEQDDGEGASQRDEMRCVAPSLLSNVYPIQEAKTIFDCAAQGDALAQQIIETTAYYIGKSCATIASVLNPKKFIIGGGVSHAGEPFRCLIEDAFQSLCFPPACEGVEIVFATLGNDAGIVGAARLILVEIPQTQESVQLPSRK